MAVLLELAAAPGQVITRNELLEAVWGGTIVQEDALTQAIARLRRLLDDDSRTPAIIETIPEQGYRLIAPVGEDVDAGPARRAPGARRASPAVWGRRQVVMVAAAATIIGMTVVAAVLRRGRDPETGILLSTTTWHEQPLTALPGEEAYPAISPDGALVAFAQRPDGAREFKLQIKRLTSGEVLPVTTEPGDETSPAWSPDGERLAFARRTGDDNRICLVALTGGPVRELGPVHLALGGLDWSPDGAHVVYSAKDRQEAPMRLLRLRVADGFLDTLSTPESLSRGDTWPRYSPDGAELAFVRSDRGSSRAIKVMPAGGGPSHLLTMGFTTCGGLAWSPDGGSLIVSATVRGPHELWRVPRSGGELALLPARSHRPLHPACGRNTGPLVFVDSVLDTELRLRPVDGGAGPVVVAPSTRADLSGRFSPNGRSVAFISERGGARELWRLDRAGGGVRRLAVITGDALRKPRWSPDGRRVAVNVAKNGWLQIVVVDVASGLQRQITTDGGHYRLGHWSIDGRYLFCSRERGAAWQISMVPVDGADAVDVDAPGCLPLHEKADGTLFYYRETEPGIFRQRPGGRQDVCDLPPDAADTESLEVTDDGFWFVRAAGDSVVLAFHDFATGRATDHGALAGRPTGEFHVSPDGRDVIYTAVARSGSDLTIVPDLH